jgi:hypothetical protein
MSHFSVLVLTEDEVTRESAEAVVTPLLAPYDENDEWFADGSRWDWWVVGGRWTGSLDGYKPHEDINNFEVCTLCQGAGVRPDWDRFGGDWYESVNGCNGCFGNGISLAFSYLPHPGDVQPVGNVAPDFVPFAIVTPTGEWLEQGRMGWFGMTTTDESGADEKPEELWAAAVRSTLEQHPEVTAVLVDCHV